MRVDTRNQNSSYPYNKEFRQFKQFWSSNLSNPGSDVNHHFLNHQLHHLEGAAYVHDNLSSAEASLVRGGGWMAYLDLFYPSPLPKDKKKR
jgi:hypothetical protein